VGCAPGPGGRASRQAHRRRTRPSTTDSTSCNSAIPQTAAGEALNALAVRFAAGNDRLAQLVRQDQDLASARPPRLDKALIAAPSPRNRPGATPQRSRRIEGPHRGGRQAARRSARRVHKASFPTTPRCRTASAHDGQGRPADSSPTDEALVVIDLAAREQHQELRLGDHPQTPRTGRTLRTNAAPDSGQGRLRPCAPASIPTNVRPFDSASELSRFTGNSWRRSSRSSLRGKPRLQPRRSTGALTSLPPQLLVAQRSQPARRSRTSTGSIRTPRRHGAAVGREPAGPARQVGRRPRWHAR
jgi:hypothetical protein